MKEDCDSNKIKQNSKACCACLQLSVSTLMGHRVINGFYQNKSDEEEAT